MDIATWVFDDHPIDDNGCPYDHADEDEYCECDCLLCLGGIQGSSREIMVSEYRRRVLEGRYFLS